MTLLNGCFVQNKSTADTTWALLRLAHHCSDNAKNPTLFLARMLLNDKLIHSFRFCSSSTCPHSPLLWSLCAFWHRRHSRGCCSHHLTSRGGTSASLNCYLAAVLPDRSPRSPGHCGEQENRLWLRFAESLDFRVIKSSQNPPGSRPGAVTASSHGIRGKRGLWNHRQPWASSTNPSQGHIPADAAVLSGLSRPWSPAVRSVQHRLNIKWPLGKDINQSFILHQQGARAKASTGWNESVPQLIHLISRRPDQRSSSLPYLMAFTMTLHLCPAESEPKPFKLQASFQAVVFTEVSFILCPIVPVWWLRLPPPLWDVGSWCSTAQVYNFDKEIYKCSPHLQQWRRCSAGWFLLQNSAK